MNDVVEGVKKNPTGIEKMKKTELKKNFQKNNFIRLEVNEGSGSTRYDPSTYFSTEQQKIQAYGRSSKRDQPSVLRCR